VRENGFHNCFFVVTDLEDTEAVPEVLLDIADLGPLIENILSSVSSYDCDGPNPAAFRTASLGVKLAVDGLARTLHTELEGVTGLSYAGLFMKRWPFFIRPKDVL
jgi:hypothetical protein